jgi:hypothetical protein
MFRERGEASDGGVGDLLCSTCAALGRSWHSPLGIRLFGPSKDVSVSVAHDCKYCMIGTMVLYLMLCV